MKPIPDTPQAGVAPMASAMFFAPFMDMLSPTSPRRHRISIQLTTRNSVGQWGQMTGPWIAVAVDDHS
jgi:hypothetical protein